MTDTTLRPICFGPGEVGPEKFKRYEHALYIAAQLSRIVYCDTGIAWHVMKHLGRSNDIVNKLITAYDSKFLRERRQPITSQVGEEGRPAESYSLVVSNGGQKYGTYISTPDDLTVLFINGSKIAANPNSIFLPTDVFISFKGSSTLANLKHDLLSQFTPSDLAAMIAPIGIQAEPGNMVTGAFVKPILAAWSALMKALAEHSQATRLFITGHSLGGAYASIFAFILCLGRDIIPGLQNKSIHVITFGAPTILGDKARNTFNALLDAGVITFDRVVNQKIAARSAATQVVVGGIVGPNDVIPNIPAGFSHPGFRPLATEFQPESKGRPYSIENVRKFYGVPSKTRYREPTTWPFPDNINLGDRANSGTLAEIVKSLTGITPPVEGAESAGDLSALETLNASPIEKQGQKQKGGFLGIGSEKAKYDAATLTHIPNFLSIQGSAYAYGFAHGEYLGMFFLGGFRMAGMKNPSKSSIAYFSLNDDGVLIKYLSATNRGGRRTLRKKKRKSRSRR